jgi:hypothetical protein
MTRDERFKKNERGTEITSLILTSFILVDFGINKSETAFPEYPEFSGIPWNFIYKERNP